MNRDDVLKMAIDAGWSVPSQWDETDGFLMRLERFAALVADAARGDYHEGWEEGFKAGVIAEREACAKVCMETTAAWTQHLYNSGCMDCAKAIRARGES